MAVVQTTGGSTAGRLGPAGAAVALGGFAVNALAYAVPLLGSRQLSPADFGALASALGIGAIATVPGMGLQAALAVRWARDGGVSNAGRASAATAAVSAGILALATPAVSAALHLPMILTPLIAVTTAAVVVGSRYLGQLQGGQRFAHLAIGMVLMAVARFGGIIVGLQLDAGVTVSVALGAGVAWAAVPLVALLARIQPRTTAAPTPTAPLHAREVVSASAATLAMLVVSYADLLLARHLLPAAASGAYGVGAVVTKGALWAPQVVTVLALPRLAQGSNRALLTALAVVGACGAVLVTASAVAGGLAVRLAGGAGYAFLAQHAVGFAAVGALYALVFVFVNAEIAARVRWPGAPLAVALVGLTVAASSLTEPTLGDILTLSIITAALTALAMAALALRRYRRAAA